MDAPTTTTPFPSIYTKFNSALNAGLLNPMSPPPPSRSSPTLFEMMANEPQPTPNPNPNPNPHSQTLTPHHRHLLLQDRVHQILSSCSLTLAPADVKLTLTSKDGVSVVAGVHREVLVGKSRFFAGRLGRGRGSVVEISECEDVEVYVEAVRLMYCGEDVRRWMVGEEVGKVLAILKVCAAIGFDAGVLSCLEYLEAAPWAEEEEEKVASLLSELRLDGSGTVEVLKRVSMEVGEGSESTNSKGSEEILLRLLQVVLEGKDEKARREMKGLVSKMLRENNNKNNAGNVLSKESLYSACDSCLDVLHRSFVRSATSDLEEVGQIARQADNLHWLLDILIDRQIADDFLRTWAAQTELAEIHPKVPAIHRYEVSRVTSRLFVGIGKGQILVSKETRCLLLKTWLEPFYEDFGWMRRACKGLDRHLIEDGLGNTILTLPLGLQQEILLVWFDRFLNSGDDCPNLQRGFEVWWRRAFWRRHSEPEQTQELRIAATSNVFHLEVLLGKFSGHNKLGT